jgi:ferredoxin
VDFWIIAGLISFIILILFFFVFSFSSLLENEKRACWRSSVFLIVFVALSFSFSFIRIPLKNWFYGSIFILLFLSGLFLLFPSLKKKKIEIVGEQRKIDERDVIFSRFDDKEKENLEAYYAQKPEYKDIDHEIRKIPDILSPPHLKKYPILFSLAKAEFDFLEHQLNQVSGDVDPSRVEFPPSENTRMIKNIIKYLGSDFCGICSLNQAYVYSHVGRGPEAYGREIELNHRFAIVFALEMDLEMVASAPQAPVIVETGKKYVEAARISIITANFIRRLGYPARAHIAGSNYQAILPPLGWEAGLGEVGRLGILITAKYGPRARLGLITTDLPLIPDKPKNLGIQNFCEKCKKCASNCPAQAITCDDKDEENGVRKWVLNRERCYRFWRQSGTDCAVCIYVCPYSKPVNAFHLIIRKMTEASAAAQRLSIWADDFFYGRIPLRRKSPLSER